jgi:hypothetical protein
MPSTLSLSEPRAPRRAGLGQAASTLVTLIVALGASGCAMMGLGPEASAKKAAKAEELGTHLVLRLGERRVYLKDEDPATPDQSFRVAIGRKPYETPVGRFQVNEMVKDPDWVKFDFKDPKKFIRRIPPGPNNPLGKRWIGFASAHGWEVGFHGTPNPAVLGQAVSHGCVRMHNDDVVKMFDKVQLGTYVIVEP